MNKTPATLLDAQLSVIGPRQPEAIQQYVLRAGAPYLSPQFISQAPTHQSGVPYWMQGIAMQTCNTLQISAPEPYQKSSITHSSPTVYQAGQYAIGSAPTTGVYTGVEGACS
jgi:hypothetical protein